MEEAKYYLSEKEYKDLINYGLDLSYLRITESVTAIALSNIAGYHLANCSEPTLLNQFRQRLAKSVYLQRSIIHLSTCYLAPTEFILNIKEVAGKKISKKYYYISLLKQVEEILEDADLVEDILAENECDFSPYIINNNLVNCLRLVVYSDDFGCSNPLGTAKSTQKVFAAYLDCHNTTWTKANDIRALIFAYRASIKAAGGIDEVLKPLVNDLISLTNLGCEALRKDGSKVMIKVKLCFVVGDNLARNEMLGFTQNFGAYFICTYCTFTYTEVKMLSQLEKKFNIERTREE